MEKPDAVAMPAAIRTARARVEAMVTSLWEATEKLLNLSTYGLLRFPISKVDTGVREN
jgi:hypothetical protein